jgi:hypothetical protein
LVSHYAEDLDRRRRAERAVEEIRTDGSNTFLRFIRSTANFKFEKLSSALR